jgi:hypothetical protein
MDYSHGAIEDAIEHFEGIANERHDVQTGALLDLWCTKGILRDAVDHGANAHFHRFGHQITVRPAAVGGNFVKISDCSL